MKRLILILTVFCASAFANEEKPIRVYVDVVGDLFHAGHVSFFKRAREHGDYLIVGVHSDEAVAAYKRTPILTLNERCAVIEACRYVDEVIVGSPVGISREWIEKYEIDLVIHGDDYSADRIEGEYRVPVEMGIFQTIPYSKGISTTDIIRRVQER